MISPNPFANVQFTGPQSTPNHASNNSNAFGVLTSPNANNLINETVENNGAAYCREASSRRRLKNTGSEKENGRKGSTKTKHRLTKKQLGLVHMAVLAARAVASIAPPQPGTLAAKHPPV
jgi:hypothetical protein